MNSRFASLLCVLSIVFFSACSNENTSTDNTDSLPNDSTATVEVPERNTTLPSPLHVAAMFKRSGMKFLPGLINPTDKATTYATSISRAQNMGVYSADMAYCVLNKQTNDAQQDMKTIRELASLINLGKIFDNTALYDRFNNNLASEDSLRRIIADIQFETDQQLEANQQNHLYGVIFSGAWIESMYIGAQVYKKEGTQNLVPTLLEQMNILKSIVTELETQQAADPAIPTLIADLKELQAHFDQMPFKKQLNDNPELGLSEIKVTKEEMDALIVKIEALRNKIVNG
ncbi:MAG: hypothetical protein ACRCYO_08550 [Bacteroidia bacterium]